MHHLLRYNVCSKYVNKNIIKCLRTLKISNFERYLSVIKSLVVLNTDGTAQFGWGPDWTRGSGIPGREMVSESSDVCSFKSLCEVRLAFDFCTTIFSCY
jgi:hypothetical protein